LYIAFVYVSAGETEAVNAYFKQFFASNTFKLLETKITGSSIHSFVKNRIKNILEKSYDCSIYIQYIHPGKLLLKQNMDKSKKNYIKFAMPVVKHTAEYVPKCCLEGILSAWDFIKGFYRYEHVFWGLKPFLFSEFFYFIIRFRSLSRKLRMQRRQI
jgi:hypothetical protein